MAKVVDAEMTIIEVKAATELCRQSFFFRASGLNNRPQGRFVFVYCFIH